MQEQEITFDNKVSAPAPTINNTEGLPLHPGPKFYWQYADADGDGFGSIIRSDSVFKKKPQPGYVAIKGDCDDTAVLINPNGKDPCGGDFNCNGIESEGQVFKSFWYDSDGDGFGNTNDVVNSCNISVPHYVSNSSDCNDAVALINPAAHEELNGIDDNCNGSYDEGLVIPGITITTSAVMIPEYMNAAGTNEMFNNNDPNDPAFISKLSVANEGAWVGSAEGHNTEWFRWKEPFGTKGNGYNATKPAPCEIMNGDLCKSFPRDFNLSWIDLMNVTGGKPIYTCNIARGTLEELYYVIDRLPDLKIIMYGQELPSGDPAYRVLDSKSYPKKFYEWVDSVKKHYPNRTFYHCSDMPDIGGKKTVWVGDFLDYKKLPLGSCLRQYSHGFTNYTLTGNITNDSSQYTYAVTTSLYKEMDLINESFPNCGVFFSQFSTGVPGYAVGTNGNMVELQSRCIDVMYYLRAENVWINATRDGTFNVLGANFIGIKNLMQTLDFKWQGVKNNLYSEPRYATYLTHTMGSQVDVVAGYGNGEYAVIIQNRSGKEVPLPAYWNLDGKIVKPVYISGSGEVCNELGSKTSSSFNPLTKGSLAPFCIVELEVK